MPRQARQKSESGIYQETQNRPLSPSSKPDKKKYNNSKLDKKLKIDGRYAKAAYNGIQTYALLLGYDLKTMTWDDVEKDETLKAEILNTYCIWDNANPELIAKVYGLEYGVKLTADVFLP